MRAFEDLLALLEQCSTALDHRAALELVEGAPEEAVWLRRWAHLIIRGGAPALLRLALAEPAQAAPRAWAERVVAVRPGLRPRLALVGTTRGMAPAMTFETGLSTVGDARFFDDDERVFAFAWGEPTGELALRFGDAHGSWLLELSRRTGAVTRAFRVGQFREENGAMALSPDRRLAAVREHRSTAIVDLASGRRVAKLEGCEGPAALRFADARHLVVLDGSQLAVWDVVAGMRLRQIDAVGFGDVALSPDGAEAVVTGAPNRTAFARYAVPSLELLEVVALDRGRSPSVLARAPSGLVATGDWDHRVRLWEPGAVAARELGCHTGWVSAVRFADHGRTLLSGGWDGQVRCWDVATGLRRAVLTGHSGFLNAIDVHGDQRHALSCGDDGDVRLWDVGAAPARADEPSAPAPGTPPFSFAYGSHGAERAARADGGRLLFRAGSHALAFAPDGTYLGAVDGGWPGGPDVRFADGDLGVASGGEHAPRCLRLLDARDAVLEEAPTCAEPLALAAVADHLGVLEADGHVSFWRVG